LALMVLPRSDLSDPACLFRARDDAPSELFGRMSQDAANHGLRISDVAGADLVPLPWEPPWVNNAIPANLWSLSWWTVIFYTDMIMETPIRTYGSYYIIIIDLRFWTVPVCNSLSVSFVYFYSTFLVHGLWTWKHKGMIVQPKLPKSHSRCFITSWCRRLAHACIQLGQQ
jgi:hypothetical protein